jgi:3-oxoacyl-[acyl-carrier protein] reductase
MSIKGRYKDKIAVITGGANGIGKAVAYRLGYEGAKLALFDINLEILQKTVKEFNTEGIEAKSYVCDINSESQVSEAIAAVEKQWKRIDILVHAAGIVGPTSTKITSYATTDFDKIYSVNLKGTFLITKYTLKVMEKLGKGRILLIASIAGKEGNPGMVGYSSTKAGVIGLVKGVAKEFATTDITVNGLAPAVIKTTMNENTSSEQLAYMTAKIPMQRLGTVEEVAAMACFIVSDENSFSTGFIYDISGGRATY